MGLVRQYDRASGDRVPEEVRSEGRFPVAKTANHDWPRYDESTLLTLAHACQRAIGLTQRPPLDQFLAQKDKILAGEEFPDEDKYYTD